MGKWYTNDDDGRIFNTARKLLGWTCIPAEATNIIDEHNADCDAYESRIAELEAQGVAERQQAAAHYQARLAAEAELAAVKAESLRVVKDGGPMMKKQTDGNDPLILGPDNELYNQRLSDEIYLMRISGNPAWAELEDDTIVQPVRLEPWESSNGD